MSFHFFFDTDEFIRETFLDVSGFHGKDGFEGIFLGPEDLDLFFMIVEFVGDVFDLLLK